MKMKKAAFFMCILSSFAINAQYRYQAHGISMSAGRQGLAYLAGAEYNIAFANQKLHKTPVLNYGAGLSYFANSRNVFSIVNNVDWMIDDLEFGFKRDGLWYLGSYFMPVLRLETSYITNFQRSKFIVNPAIGISWQYFLQARFSYIMYNQENYSDLIPGKYRVCLAFYPYLLRDFFYTK